MKLVTLAVLLAALYSSLAFSEGCEFGAGEKLYVSGSGARIRDTPSLDGKIVKILKFNEMVCSTNADNEKWVKVSTNEVATQRGWLPKEFVSREPTDLQTVQKNLAMARAIKDYKNAVMWAERLVDMSTGPGELDALNQLKLVLEMNGDKTRAAEVAARAKKLEDEGLDDASVERWFFTKFGESSPYFTPPPPDKVTDADINKIITFLEKHPAGENENALRDPALQLLAVTVYPTAHKKMLWSIKTTDNIYKKELLLAVMVKYSTMVEFIPADKLKDPELQQRIVAQCLANPGADSFANFWRAMTPQQMKEFANPLLDCLPSAALAPFMKASGLNSDEKFIVDYVNLSGRPEAFRNVFAGLTDQLKSSQKILTAVLKSEKPLDIYSSLSPAHQQQYHFKEQALRSSPCADIMKVNPTDRVLFIKLVERITVPFNLECIDVLDMSLREDVGLAEKVIKTFPTGINHFGPKAQINPKLVMQAANSEGSAQYPCAIDNPSKIPDIDLKVQLVTKRRSCLRYLSEIDLLNPKIYKAVLSAKIDAQLAEKLPTAYSKDPKVLPSLEINDWPSKELLLRYQNPQVLLDIAKTRGINGLRPSFFYNIAEPNSEEASFRSLLSDGENHGYTKEFWKKMVEYASKKEAGCGTWREFLGPQANPQDYGDAMVVDEILKCGWKVEGQEQ